MPNTWNVQWLNENLNRSYPFREDASLADTTGGFTIPNWLLVDALFVIPFGSVVEAYAYLSRMTVAGRYLTLYFDIWFASQIEGSESKSVGYVIIDTESAQKYGVYTLGQPDDYYEESVCRITVGDLSEISTYVSDGDYVFLPANSQMEQRIFRPELRGVRALRIVSGSDVSQSMRGNINLVAGTNVRLDADVATNTITFNAISGAGMQAECDCDSSFPVKPPIRSINGVGPDANGNLVLQAGECMEVVPQDNTILVRDTCSAPCCGCSELDLIVSNLSLVESGQQRLSSNVDRLSARMETFYNNVLLSMIR